MSRKPRFFNILAILIIVLILLVSTGTFALAQEGGGEEPVAIPGSEPSAPQAPVPGGPGFLMIPAAAFTPSNFATQYFLSISLRTVSGSQDNTYTAPVYLPNGVTVNRVSIIISDTHPQILDGRPYCFFRP